MDKDVPVWHDREGDSLEMFFEQKDRHVRKTDNDAVMETVDQEEYVIGFSIFNTSRKQSETPVSVPLRGAAA